MFFSQYDSYHFFLCGTFRAIADLSTTSWNGKRFPLRSDAIQDRTKNELRTRIGGETRKISKRFMTQQWLIFDFPLSPPNKN